MNIVEWIKKRNYSTKIFIVLVLLWFIVLPIIIILRILFNIIDGLFSYINLLFMGFLILITLWLVFNSIESVIRGVIQKKFKEYLISKIVALLLVSTMVIVRLIMHSNGSIVRSNFLIKLSDIVFIPAVIFYRHIK